MELKIKRGDLFYADLSPVVGSEQGGIRPVVVIQNDVGNRYSPTVIVAAVTSHTDKKSLPTHITINADFIPKDSIILLEQIRTIDKQRLQEPIGTLDENDIKRINEALGISVGLRDIKRNEMNLTLCPACAHQFYYSSQHYIKRADITQVEKETCMYCNVRTGFDYIIITKEGNNDDSIN